MRTGHEEGCECLEEAGVVQLLLALICDCSLGIFFCILPAWRQSSQRPLLDADEKPENDAGLTAKEFLLSSACRSLDSAFSGRDLCFCLLLAAAFQLCARSGEGQQEEGKGCQG